MPSRRPHCPGAVVAATAAVLTVLTVLAPGAAGQATSSPAAVPEPPLVVSGGASDGQVTVSPSTQTVADGTLQWLLSNGGESTLTFELALRTVIATDGGVRLGAGRGDLPLDATQLRLAPSEVARIRVPVPADAARGVIALVASTVEAEPATQVSGLALIGSGTPVRSGVVAADSGARTVTVRLDSDGPALVNVAVRGRAWPGIETATTQVDGVLVPAGGRDLEVTVSGLVVGRVTMQVAVAGGEPSDTAMWWWPLDVTVVLVLLLVAVVGGLAGVVRWRRHRPAVTAAPAQTDAATGADAAPDPGAGSDVDR